MLPGAKTMLHNPLSGLEEFLPKVELPLDKDFRPASLANREFLNAVNQSGKAMPVAFAIEREDGLVERFDTVIFDGSSKHYKANYPFIERLVKSALWNWGGHKIIWGGPVDIGQYLQWNYSKKGAQAFDADMMGNKTYEVPFSVQRTNLAGVPQARESSLKLGGNWEGYRTGIDLGKSDIKWAALIGGKRIKSGEFKWDPSSQQDPGYHYEQIKKAIDLATDYLPSIDAIGVSAAGIYVNNRVRVASLFRGVDAAGRMQEAGQIFYRLSTEFGAPLAVINDGTVTALKGRMDIPDAKAVLGLAMGSGVAGGVTTANGKITTRLDEFEFVPIDYSPNAQRHYWSPDIGIAGPYLSQQALEFLLPKAGISEFPPKAELAVRLQHLQKLIDKGDPRAYVVYQTIGAYCGYALPQYLAFYKDVSHVLVLGRVVSGRGGDIIINKAKEVLATEFPEINIEFCIPKDDRQKRQGQAIVAASLPYIQR